jgi:predicted AlkP superfamily pyrophosphatase or phosphodiesterase
MKKYNNLLCVLMGAYLLLTHTVTAYNPHPPRLVVVIVVDQLAHHYFNKLMPYLKYGLRYLVDNGVVYTNAHMPHGQPGTATGHAGLSTGTCAKDHGFVSNSWYENGNKVACDDDPSQDALVLSPDGTYTSGKSPWRLMVDGLSDQCVMQSEPNSEFYAYSISGKSRAAIATASKMGKALWFDSKTGLLTSSKAYFDELPGWLKLFNRDNNINERGSIVWQRMYPRNPYAYNFFNIQNYDYSQTKKTMLDTPLPVCDPSQGKNSYYFFERTPQANEYLLDCAQACIKAHVSRKHRDRLLLWVCLSPLDKVVHKYGPYSLEAIDMLYHLDKQLQRFIRQTLRVIGKHEVVFALTADHGIMPIPEILHKEGLTQAQRVDRHQFIDGINQVIEKKHGVKNSIVTYKGQELVLNMAILDKVSNYKRSAVINDIKLCLLKKDGIKNVWSFDDLCTMCTQPNTLEDNIKNQLFKGRSGSIIIQTYPYALVTHWSNGTSHKTPYDYDTHVPLIILHPGKFERKCVRKRVVALQLANTLAELLNVAKPSASMYDILPDLFDGEYK